MAEIKPISGIDDRVPLAHAVPLTTPFTFNVFPTNLCNFRCNYCAQSLGRDYLTKIYGFSYGQLSLEIFEKAVGHMQKFPEPFKLVSFMGHGEPLLNKAVPDMIAAVNKAKVAGRTEIITNGSQLTHEYSERLVEAGVSAIRISLQGITAEKYWEISRVKIDFDKFIDELKYYSSLSKDSKLYVKIVDTSLADGDEQRFYELFDPIADRMYVENIKPVYAGVEYNEAVTEVKADRYGNTHSKREVCPLAFYMLALWPNGDVAPCDAIYKPLVLGNIADGDDLYDMWHSERIEDFWDLLLNGGRFDFPPCVECCAPDDVSHSLDVLDNDVFLIKERLAGRKKHRAGLK